MILQGNNKNIETQLEQKGVPWKFNIDTTNKAIEKVCPFQIWPF